MVWITVYRYFLFENEREDISELRLVYFSILLQACGATIEANSKTNGEIN